MKTLKYSWFIGLIALLTLTNCSEDYLVRPPEDSLTDVDFYKTNEEVMAATAPLYSRMWFDYNDKASYSIGDLRSGIMMAPWNSREFGAFNANGDNSEVIAGWNAFFTVIQQANLAIRNINTYATEAVSEDIKKMAVAEARFMRACAYRNLVLAWGPVPIITDNIAIMNDTDIKRNTISSIWKFLTNEMRAAAEDLPEEPYATGRVTRYSAEGMLARFYLTRAGVESDGGTRNQTYLDSAKYYAQSVIVNSGKSLLDDYRSLFLYPYDNNNESLFELQWVYSSAWGPSNSVPAYLAYNSDIGNGDGWGGAYSASWYVISQYEGINVIGTTGDSIRGATLDTRLYNTFMLPGAHYPEITQDYTASDGTVGQRECIYPNNTSDYSFACTKKYIVGKAVDVAEGASSQHYPNNTYMLRLAEIYLIYAEAVLGNNEQSSDATALEYVNKIRRRAGLNNLPNDSGDGDKTYFTFADVFKERTLEFAMESMFMYDLSNIFYYDKAKALGILNNQDRGLFAIYPDVYPDPNSWTFVKTSWHTERSITATEGNFYLPIPTADLGGMPSLTEEPVDYYGSN
ncbi:RagB/SusD family nutrient uptake outer membrane protein [Maribellus sp. CM-23]|uniref:RagB/SusD family nutrient uptake outer membrane protein n=1 Tax=Maribellus sp. CM-23 TaxID=2781026 RepID=UPI001F2AF4B2|nr:RagB/SusD family nutrient uptake outer membrane protein [Maribellus sp. CM-23]MCE4566672.1 RagB/SusD family nutrient uptake outer membrane protein [Maribellus sp. CM-23]